MKTNKSFTKRIKVTRNGKLITRKPGQDHFNAKSSGNERSAKRRTQGLIVTSSVRRRFLGGNGGKKPAAAE
jgi:ribosomal protein L35